MAEIRCKMCGSVMSLYSGVTTGSCSSCYTAQTLPDTDDAALLSLYDAAGDERRAGNFEGAEKLYRKILEKEPGQLEARWGLVLCRYGVTYVKDPIMLSYVPSCTLPLDIPVTDDEDYKEVKKSADMSRRSYYESEARNIDSTRRELILAQASKQAAEAPADFSWDKKDQPDWNKFETPEDHVADDVNISGVAEVTDNIKTDPSDFFTKTEISDGIEDKTSGFLHKQAFDKTADTGTDDFLHRTPLTADTADDVSDAEDSSPAYSPDSIAAEDATDSASLAEEDIPQSAQTFPGTEDKDDWKNGEYSFKFEKSSAGKGTSGTYGTNSGEKQSTASSGTATAGEFERMNDDAAALIADYNDGRQKLVQLLAQRRKLVEEKKKAKAFPTGWLIAALIGLFVFSPAGIVLLFIFILNLVKYANTKENCEQTERRLKTINAEIQKFESTNLRAFVVKGLEKKGWSPSVDDVSCCLLKNRIYDQILPIGNYNGHSLAWNAIGKNGEKQILLCRQAIGPVSESEEKSLKLNFPDWSERGIKISPARSLSKEEYVNMDGKYRVARGISSNAPVAWRLETYSTSGKRLGVYQDGSLNQNGLSDDETVYFRPVIEIGKL